MCYGEIYIIANFINDKLYVGQTKKGIDVRWRSHINHSNSSKRGKTPKSPIDRAIYKYGPENFCMYVVDEAKDQDELNRKEQEWIKKLDTMNIGYNINPGGGYRKEYHLSEENQRKLSERMRGEKHFNYGKHLREDTRKKISESVSKFQHQEGYVHPCTGKPRTEEVKRKVKENWGHQYIKCPHCGVVMERRTAKRYHFDNCPRLNNKLMQDFFEKINKYKFEG